MPDQTGILLVNLGTPQAAQPSAVKKYLIEFLTDSRVIDIPWLWRQLLVRSVIVPRRYKQSAASYQAIWTEEGSPLYTYSKKMQQKLQQNLGENFIVELAMRYQQPSLEKTLTRLLQLSLKRLIIMPLFPQYASATTGSIYEKVLSLLKKQIRIPALTFINNFAGHPSFIEAWCQQAHSYDLNSYDHFLFSFHGLPERQLKKADPCHFCLKTADCCQKITSMNANCYAAQCHLTANKIIEQLGLLPTKVSLCFQSRLGKEPWLQPYASQVIKKLAEQGKKRVLVFSPSFVCDCLETIYEIGVEYALEFKEAGGEKLQLVKSLNDSDYWITALKKIILEN